MTDTISSDETPRWPVFERPPHGGRYGERLRRFGAATQTTAMTAAVSLVLLGGVATVTARSLAHGADPADVVPASAFAIAQVDLSLPDGQDEAASHLLARFPGALKGSGSIRDRLLGALFASSSNPHVDYRNSVKPWLGDHAAIAGWTDDSGAAQIEVVLESTDDAAARKSLRKTSNGGMVFSHGFAVLAPTQRAADAAVHAAGKSALSNNRTYTNDVAALGGSPIVTAWLDGPPMVKALSHYLSEQPGGLDLLSGSGLTDGNPGRIVAGLRVSDDGDNSAVQLDVVARGGPPSHRTTSANRLRHLPATTFAAIAIADPAGIVRDFATAMNGALSGFFAGFGGVHCTASSDNPDPQCDAPQPPGDQPDPLTIMSTAIGIAIPDDLVSLLGSDAVVAYGGLAGGGVPKIGLRSKPADLNAAADVAAKLRTKLDGIGVKLAERKAGGDFVLATTDGYAGDLAADGTLGTTPRFADAMRGMPSSVAFATYVDLGALLPLAHIPPQLDHFSALGVWSAGAGTTSTTRVRLIIH